MKYNLGGGLGLSEHNCTTNREAQETNEDDLICGSTSKN